MNPQYVTPPEHLERALRDLITGWQEVVFSEPTATDDYRALTQQAALDIQAALGEGGTPDQAAIFALAPVFAAADEETVEAVLPAHEGRVNTPVHVEIGDTPGDLPETPPEHRAAAKQTLELLLGGWTDAVAKADISDHYRRVVGETVQRVREAAEYGTTPHNLIATLFAAAFLLPDEPEPTSITTADLEALGRCSTGATTPSASTRRCSTTFKSPRDPELAPTHRATRRRRPSNAAARHPRSA